MGASEQQQRNTLSYIRLTFPHEIARAGSILRSVSEPNLPANIESIAAEFTADHGAQDRLQFLDCVSDWLRQRELVKLADTLGMYIAAHRAPAVSTPARSKVPRTVCLDKQPVDPDGLVGGTPRLNQALRTGPTTAPPPSTGRGRKSRAVPPANPRAALG